MLSGQPIIMFPELKKPILLLKRKLMILFASVIKWHGVHGLFVPPQGTSGKKPWADAVAAKTRETTRTKNSAYFFI